MKQLTGLDAGFLALDSASVCSHLGCVAVLDPPARGPGLTRRSLADLIESRLHVAPPFRRRLAEVPFGLDQPYWIEDPDFELGFHLREAILPAPGDETQLAAAVARLHERPLDRRRPLWEMHLIHGLAGGRKALYTKVHHAAIDGVAGNNLLIALFDTAARQDGQRPADPWHPDRQPTALELLARSAVSAARRPSQLARLSAQALRSLPALAAGPRLPGRSLIAPPTPFNKMLGPRRVCAFGTLPLATVKRVKESAGATVNDVVMALCAGALRRWLLDHHALPEVPLLAAVPVNTRSDDTNPTEGNRLGKIIAALPTHLANPEDRLRATRDAMAAAKARFAALPPTLFTDIVQPVIPALAGPAMRLANRVRLLERVSPLNLFVSNVPGPTVEMFLGGSRLHAVYPLSTIADGQGINITVLGSAGKLNVGVIADPELVPDVDAVLAGLVAELALLDPRSSEATIAAGGGACKTDLCAIFQR